MHRWRELVNAIVKILFSWQMKELLSSCATISFSRRSILFGHSDALSVWLSGLCHLTVFVTSVPENLLRRLQGRNDPSRTLAVFYPTTRCHLSKRTLSRSLLLWKPKISHQKCWCLQRTGWDVGPVPRLGIVTVGIRSTEHISSWRIVTITALFTITARPQKPCARSRSRLVSTVLCSMLLQSRYWHGSVQCAVWQYVAETRANLLGFEGKMSNRMQGIFSLLQLNSPLGPRPPQIEVFLITFI
jgi:hypothetical protein